MRPHRVASRLLVVASLLAGLAPLAAPRRADAAATIVVNTTAFQDAANDECSIYEAIIAANTNADYKGCVATNAGVGDSIVFAFSPFDRRIFIGPFGLPPITEWVTIDGGAGRVELRGPGGPLVSGRHGLTVMPTGFGTIIRNLVINNFADDGIFINADEVWVFGCRIGTDASGTMAMPNQGFGIQVFGGNGVRVGGATSGGECSGDCNLISAASRFKANVLLDLKSINALVRGNFLGTDVTGTVALTPSDGQGIVDKGSGNRIGGTFTTPGGPCTGDCNLISGNKINGGIVLDQAATGALVQGNFVGTDVTGTAPISNGVSEGFSVGILSYANGATIGGTTPAARNVVSGNIGTGIQVRGSGTKVLGNYLGTNAAGTAAVPGSGPGVTLYQADSATVGGFEPGAANLISGASNNGASGVQALYSTNALIVGNWIGTAADGSTPLPNLAHGVHLLAESSNNFVGGASEAAGNVIAFNGQDGVRVDGNQPQVRSNTVRANRIYANEGSGIALIAGANDNLAPPTITGADPLHGTSCAQCIVEIFSDADGQGAVFEGSVYSPDGTWSFDGTPSGPHVTATNTDNSNNTSPFSAPFALATPTPSASPTPPATATPTATATPPATATRTATATRSATAVASATLTAPATATATATTASPSATAVASATPTGTAAASASPTATAPAVCVGDCDHSGAVTIEELIKGVSVALGALPANACPAFENAAGIVDIAQLVRGVANALDGCGPPV